LDNTSNKSTTYIIDALTILIANSKSECFKIEELDFNIIVTNDNYKINHDYDKLLSSNFDYVFSFNNLKAIENINQLDLIKNVLIYPLINGYDFTNEKKPISNQKNIPYIVITTKKIIEVNTLKLNNDIEDYIIKKSNKKKDICKIKLYTNSLFLFNKQVLKYNNFNTILNHIYKNLYKEDFNVNALSAITGYSQRQLSRIISSETNMTPAKYILELRLKKAHELLASDKHLKIKEVKYSIGINSSSYFSKKFKARFGFSPSDFKA